jgi:hypothetical protein
MLNISSNICLSIFGHSIFSSPWFSIRSIGLLQGLTTFYPSPKQGPEGKRAVDETVEKPPGAPRLGFVENQRCCVGK